MAKEKGYSQQPWNVRPCPDPPRSWNCILTIKMERWLSFPVKSRGVPAVAPWIGIVDPGVTENILKLFGS